MLLERKVSLSTYLAVTGAVVGIAGGLFLGGVRVANSERPELRAEWVGNLVFTLVYLTPFLLSLFALRWPAPWQAAVWGGTAILAGLGVYTTFSGVSLVLLPAGLLLLPAALAAFSQSAPAHWPVALLVAGLLVVLVAGGWWSLIGGAGDGRCWELVRGPAGETAWERVPYNQGGAASTSTAGEEAGTLRVLCTSDVITVVEAGLGLLPLAVAVIGVIWLARRWPTVSPGNA